MLLDDVKAKSCVVTLYVKKSVCDVCKDEVSSPQPQAIVLL